MSKLFYDHLVDLSELEKLIKKHVKDAEARHEIYQLIDEAVNNLIHQEAIGSESRADGRKLDEVNKRKY